ncbi:hypothetical protein V5R04_10970 [Jonesiaceae bacterium BS-20]|uniref:Lipoprotein n=1 Tax=Jonesiaceae bacterium BS-20 TaxID=3120821 RepID=A0AAU7DVG8_9MICO
MFKTQHDPVGERCLSLRRSAPLVLLAALVVVTSACTPDVEVASPYAAQFEDARRGATTQFEADALADDKISRAEYVEAEQRFVDCIASHGGKVELEDQTGYFTYAITGDIELYDSVSDQCGQGANALISPLYVDILMNPNRTDFDELMANCLIDVGLVDRTFTKEDMADLEVRANGGNTSTSLADDGTTRMETHTVAIDPAAQAIMEHPDAQNCMANPDFRGIANDSEDN